MAGPVGHRQRVGRHGRPCAAGAAALAAAATAATALGPLRALLAGTLGGLPLCWPRPTAALQGSPAARCARGGAAGFGGPAATKRPAGLKRRRPPRRGFSAPTVSDEPPTGYDEGPKHLTIVRYPHPALRRPNAEVEVFDGRLRQLAENLFRSMYEETDPPGIGLAAPQVGVNVRVLVYNGMRMPEAENREGDTVFVNPRITAHSDDRDEAFECCLSFPKMEGPVIRPVWVEVEAVDLEGRPFKRRIEGEEARLFQHEYDHLDGVLYIDRMDEADMPPVKKTLNKLKNEYTMGGGKQPAP